jgi:hypothetical protein
MHCLWNYECKSFDYHYNKNSATYQDCVLYIIESRDTRLLTGGIATGATDHYDLAFRPDRYREPVDYLKIEELVVAEALSKGFNLNGKEPEESSSAGVVVTLLFIIVIACAVGIIWKRKQNAKDAAGQKDFDGVIVMPEQGKS